VLVFGTPDIEIEACAVESEFGTPLPGMQLLVELEASSIHHSPTVLEINTDVSHTSSPQRNDDLVNLTYTIKFDMFHKSFLPCSFLVCFYLHCRVDVQFYRA
jgi:hypothetical protein